jgi:hypothetical protein
MSEKVVFATKDQKRFFHIPGDAELAAGPLVLRNLKGEKKEVDEAAVSGFEIPEEQAKAIVAEDLKKFARNAQDFLTKAASVMRAAAAPTPEKTERQGKAEMNFAAILGMTPDEVRGNPEKTMEALKATLMGMATTLRDAARNDDPESKVAAEGRMRAVAEHIKTVGGEEYAGPIEELPERLKKFLADPKLEQQIRDASSRLKELAAELRVEADVGKDRTE